MEGCSIERAVWILEWIWYHKAGTWIIFHICRMSIRSWFGPSSPGSEEQWGFRKLGSERRSSISDNKTVIWRNNTLSSDCFMVVIFLSIKKTHQDFPTPHRKLDVVLMQHTGLQLFTHSWQRWSKGQRQRHRWNLVATPLAFCPPSHLVLCYWLAIRKKGMQAYIQTCRFANHRRVDCLPLQRSKLLKVNG